MNKLYKTLIVLCFLISLSSNSMSEPLPSFVYSKLTISEECDDEIRSLVKDGAQLIHIDSRKARHLLVKALEKAKNGKEIDEYSFLYAQYGLLMSFSSASTSDFKFGSKEDYQKVSRNVFEYLDKTARVAAFFEFTEYGAFQIELYRHAANGLAWYQFEDNDDVEKLEEALMIVSKAENYIRDESHYFILDTKVRILLKLNQKQQAFEIVKPILNEVPSFRDFQDFHSNEAFQLWLKQS